MGISCSICRYGESHDYLKRYYCKNKNCYQSRCFDQPETFNCPHGKPKRGLRSELNLMEDSNMNFENEKIMSKLERNGTCSTCCKEDVCAYKEAVQKTINEMTTLANNSEISILAKISCGKWAAQTMNTR